MFFAKSFVSITNFYKVFILKNMSIKIYLQVQHNLKWFGVHILFGTHGHLYYLVYLSSQVYSLIKLILILKCTPRTILNDIVNTNMGGIA